MNVISYGGTEDLHDNDDDDNGHGDSAIDLHDDDDNNNKDTDDV